MIKLQELRAYQAASEVGIQHPQIVIDHEAPATTINSIRRMLIFPKSLLSFLRPKTRGITFMGYKTANRKAFMALALQSYPRARIKWSRRGRYEETRILDIKYFFDIARSRFVLCPDGDFVWTYRFFEACLLKAMPIVEHACPQYKGYAYLKVGDKLAYDRGAIERNFAKAKAELML